jgi:hypothetical protein
VLGHRCDVVKVKVLVVLVKSGVGSERLYNSKKESLRVFVVVVLSLGLGEIGIDYGWMVKRGKF